MKKNILILMLVATAMMVCGEEKWYPGRVVLTDGARIEFAGLLIPSYQDAVVTASSTDDHLDLSLFEANDVDYIEFWHPSFPSKVHRLYSIRLKHQRPRTVAHFWGQRGITTECGYIVTCYHRYELNEETGNLERKVQYGVKNFRSPHPFAMLPNEKYYQPWPVTPSCLYDIMYRDAGTRVGGGGRQEIDMENPNDGLDPMMSAFEEGSM